MSELKIDDLKEAEKALDEAVAQFRAYNADHSQWSGHQTVNRDGYRGLVLNESHFQHIEMLQRKVERASRHLSWARAEFFGQNGGQL